MAPPLAFGFRGGKLYPQGCTYIPRAGWGGAFLGPQSHSVVMASPRPPLTPPLVKRSYISHERATAAWRWLMGGSLAALEADTAAGMQA